MRSSTASKYTSLGITGLCFYAIYGILGCGGGGSAPNMAVPNSGNKPSALVHNYRQFAPFEQSVCRDFSAGRWCSAVSPSGIDVTWGDSTEEFTVRQYAGELWAMLDAYREDKKGKRYEIKTTRVEIDYGTGWQTLPNDTNPYSPINIVGPFTLRQWGIIAGEKRYFWQHRIEPSAAYNPCWLGPGDSNRPTLKQTEVWWDEVGGWTRGTGVLKDGLPTGEVVMDFFQHIAKDAGYVWTGSNGLCLIR